MTEFKLKVDQRTSKPIKTRQDGYVPAVVYGKSFDPEAIAIKQIDFEHIYREAGSSNLIEMSLEDKNFKTLIHEIQKDPITGTILHVDFIKVNMKEKIHAEIPLIFIGDSPAVMNLEGSLITPVDSIEVECLPGDLIPEFEVDISVLDDFEKNIKVSDLKFPEGVEIENDTEEIVAFVQEPRSEEEMAELEEAVEENVEAVEVEHTGEETATEGEGEATDAGEKPAEEKKEE